MDLGEEVIKEEVLKDKNELFYKSVNEDGVISVFAPNTEYQKVRDALVSLYPDVNFLEDHTTWIPSNYVKLEDDHDKQKFERFMEMLDDCDDVQNIYHNISNE